MHNRPLWALSLYQLLSNNRSSLFTVYFVLFAVQKDHATVSDGLTAFSVAYVSASLISPLAGRLSDRMGERRKLLLIAEASSLPFFVSIPFVNSFLAVSVLFLVAETILSSGQTALQAFVADITPATERGRGYGFVNAIGSAGAVVGTLGAGVVAQIFGLSAIFYLVGFLGIGTILLVLVTIPKHQLPKSEGKRRPIREMKDVAIFSFATSIRTLGTGAVIAFLGTYATILHANNFEVSLVAVASLVTAAILGTFLGRQVDNLGEIRAYILGTTIVVFSLVMYVVANSWIYLIPAGIVYALGFYLLSPAMLSWVTKIAPENRKAEYLGFFSMINSTLWSFGPIPGGIAQASSGNLGLFAFALGTTLISLGSVYAIYSRPRRSKQVKV
jgi:MFS family permease